jgi:hypothetical protein
MAEGAIASFFIVSSANAEAPESIKQAAKRVEVVVFMVNSIEGSD